MSLPVRFILGSGSPRRKFLLEGLGIPFDIIVSNVDERVISGELPEEHCARLATAKAEAVAATVPEALTLGADTAVIVDGEIFGKPVDMKDAVRILGIISGRWHTVITAFTLICLERKIKVERVESSEVFIRNLSTSQIEWYIDSGEPMDKAGAYAIQGIGASLVKKVKGSYTCVVGLPLAETVIELEKLFGSDCLLGSR